MIFVSAATAILGSNDFYPEERPEREAYVPEFFIDQTPVTNAEFNKFVESTGYVTLAEQEIGGPVPSPPGSAVFVQPSDANPTDDWRNWWVFVPGACWYAPKGPKSNIDALMDHPVVHVGAADAQAFAQWCQKDLPSETEWEMAARGGQIPLPYSWGHELRPLGRDMVNIWHGQFPWENTEADGFARTSPVAAFPPNAFGLYDMIGNVWQWTRDSYAQSGSTVFRKSCCAPGTLKTEPSPSSGAYHNIIKGGSHLCAPNYCQRYRPAARMFQEKNMPTSHIGFRCVSRVEESRC